MLLQPRTRLHSKSQSPPGPLQAPQPLCLLCIKSMIVEVTGMTVTDWPALGPGHFSFYAGRHFRVTFFVWIFLGGHFYISWFGTTTTYQMQWQHFLQQQHQYNNSISISAASCCISNNKYNKQHHISTPSSTILYQLQHQQQPKESSFGIIFFAPFFCTIFFCTIFCIETSSRRVKLFVLLSQTSPLPSASVAPHWEAEQKVVCNPMLHFSLVCLSGLGLPECTSIMCQT